MDGLGESVLCELYREIQAHVSRRALEGNTRVNPSVFDQRIDKLGGTQPIKEAKFPIAYRGGRAVSLSGSKVANQKVSDWQRSNY